MKKCPVCGSIVEDTSNICGICGHTLSMENTIPKPLEVVKSLESPTRQVTLPRMAFGRPPMFCPICKVQLFQKNDFETPQWAQKNFASRLQFGNSKWAVHWLAYYKHAREIHPAFARASNNAWKYPTALGIALIIEIIASRPIFALGNSLLTAVFGLSLVILFVFGFILLPAVYFLVRRFFVYKYRRLWKNLDLTE